MNQDLEIKIQVKQILKVIQEIAPARSVELRNHPMLQFNVLKVAIIEGEHHLVWLR